MKSLAFTGHRFLKTQGQESWAHGALDDAVARAIQNGITWFTSGGAPYWDWWFLDACKAGCKQLACEQGLPDGVVISAALPFRGFWNYYAKKRKDDAIYIKNNLLEYVEPIIFVTDEDAPKARPRMLQLIHARNRFLVNEHDALLALWDGERQTGGTVSTIKYARKVGKPVLLLDAKKKTEQWLMPG